MIGHRDAEKGTGDDAGLFGDEIKPEKFRYASEERYRSGLDEINDDHVAKRNGNAPVEQEGHGQKEFPVDNEARGEEFLEVLLEGARVPLDINVPLNSRPPWIDNELLRKGREFGIKCMFGLVYSQMLSLAILFSFRGGLEPLIFTDKSGTPYTAFRRYLSTVMRIMSWYESDVFEKGSEAHNNMAAVRDMHASVFKRMNEASSEDLKSKVTLEGKGTGVWCTYLEVLEKDFKDLRTDNSRCPFAQISSLKQQVGRKSGGVYVNQLELALTQFGFVTLIVLYPRQFGAHGATEDELRGYVHLWRCLGYFLGIEDRYNICSSGDLEVTRGRCRAVIEKWTIPGLKDLTPEWEHMFRCVVEGISYYVPGNSFASSIAYLLWILDVPSPNLLSKMTWLDKMYFSVTHFVLNYVLRIPGCLRFFNYLLGRSIRRTSNASVEWLREKREKVYDFQKVAKSRVETAP